ncbi:hypothetical protein AB1Y20_000640 [Prymnesium parvum]|uniref:Vps72/YL1 C-terminal domain-containing protein n=1 Tax=Prymnesium parvum TaxID=97485 RepID=A0AB34K5X6_PRYPA
MSVAGVGVIRFWGFSPAVDLLEDLAAIGCAVDSAADEDPLRLLMVCPGDVRHVLQTLAGASSRRVGSGADVRPFEACVFEKEPETLARHALLLAVALDFELPRRERAELLLELWANSLLREKTASYLATKARQLSRAVSEEEGLLAPLIDVSALKMKDRDRLEEIFRSWAEDVEFDVVRLRDERLRNFYKARYEHRASVLDWDYTWELMPIASIVHKIHFREWRMTGVLFEVRDSAYTAPNRTMASYAYGRQKGSSVQRRGFWCDIANGPFAAMGVTCDDERLTAKKSDRHTKSSNDIAYYVMLQWLTAIENGTRFQLKQEDIHDFEYGASVNGGGAFMKGFLTPNSKLDGVVEEVDGHADEADVVDVEEEARAHAIKAKVCAAKLEKLPKFKLKLLCGDWLDVVRKPRHQHAFDALTLGTHVAYLCADKRVNQLLKERAAICVETAKFLVELRGENRKEYGTKLHACALSLGWTARESGEADGIKSACFRYCFDANVAKAHLERIKDAPPAEPLQLMGPEVAEDETAAGSPALDGEGRPTGTEAVAADDVGLGCLQIAAEQNDERTTQDSTPDIVAQSEPVILPGGQVMGTSQAELSAIGNGGKICAITGLPAKYKDPVTGLPYANLDAYKELRKRHPDPKKPLPSDEKEEASEVPEFQERLRPILTGGMGRRVNKACS